MNLNRNKRTSFPSVCLVMPMCLLAIGVEQSHAQLFQEGACCLPNGNCVEITDTSCASQGGTFQGARTTCTTHPCPGACCLSGGGCSVATPRDCLDFGGFFQDGIAECSNAGCGACCLPSGATPCQPAGPTQCNAERGVFLGAGTACGAASCAEACCLPNGTCSEIDLADCDEQNGQGNGLGSECANFDCDGACCLSDGTCVDTGPPGCASQSGLFQGLSAACGSTDCAGACCLPDGACVETGSTGCASQDGLFRGLSAICASTDCAGACCLPDGECIETREDTCTASNGLFNGIEAGCADVACRGACCLPGKLCMETGENGCAGQYQGGGTTCSMDCPSPLSTAFTYQGQAKQSGVPLSGEVDLEFSLWISEAGGVQVGPTLSFNSVPVINGLLTVELDFGAAAFNGNARWLEINVRSPHDPTDTALFTTLSPRQPLNAIPYAGFAARPWASDKVNVFYTGGNVGIGTTAPALPLHVSGKARFGAGAVTGNNVSLAPDVNTGRDGIHISNGPDRRLELYTWGLYNDIKSIGAPLSINHDSQQDVYLCRDGGNVGIGTTGPNNRLSVNGGADLSGRLGIGTTTAAHSIHVRNPVAGLRLESQSPSSTHSKIEMINTQLVEGSNARGAINWVGATGTIFGQVAYNTDNNAQLIFRANTTEVMRMTSGRVAVNRSSASHPIHVGTSTANGNGAHLTAGGSWTNGSDRNSKDDFQAIDKQAVLAKLLDMPLMQWRYKGEPEDVKHLGPSAQDFHAAFGLGESDTHIGTIDADGVALAAIQGLYEIVKDKTAQIASLHAEQDAELTALRAGRDARLEALRDENAELRVRLERIEKMLAGNAQTKERTK